MAISSWSTTAGSNTTIDGININEGCPSGNVNNGLRSIMANVRTWYGTFSAFVLGIVGSTDAATFRTAIGALGSADIAGKAAAGANSDITSLSGLTTPLSIAQGGTGSTTGGFTSGSNTYGYWRKTPDDVIEQWGRVTAAANGSTTITFPISFTDGSSVVCNCDGAGEFGVSAIAMMPTVYTADADTATLFSGSDNPCTAYWRAIGY